MSAHKTRSDSKAGSLGLRSKKRVRIQTDEQQTNEQQAETNEEEDDRRKRPAGGRAIDEAVAEEQRSMRTGSDRVH